MSQKRGYEPAYGNAVLTIQRKLALAPQGLSLSNTYIFQ